jgi:hypothetical protein
MVRVFPFALSALLISSCAFAQSAAGGAGGGVTNAVTKSGANTYYDNAFWFYRDRFMNANTWLNNPRGITRQPCHYSQFAGTLGGPILKDKRFFFLGHDGQRNKNPNPVFFPLAPPIAALTATTRQPGSFLQPATSARSAPSSTRASCSGPCVSTSEPRAYSTSTMTI